MLETPATTSGSMMGDRWIRIVVRGELDLLIAPALRIAVWSTGEEEVVLDLSSVTFIDLAGLRVLRASYEIRGGRLRIIASP